MIRWNHTLALATLLSAPVFAETQVESFKGTAVNKKGEIVYLEEQEATYENGQVRKAVSKYFSPDGKPIAELLSDFRFGPGLPDTTYRDLRTGAEDGAKITETSIELFRKKNGTAAVETKSVKRSGDQVVGQGFHHLLRTNLDSFHSDALMKVTLMLPIRLTDFNFRIRKSSLQGDVVSLKFESDSWLLRLLAPSVELSYDIKAKRILGYKGRSNVDDPTGHAQDVTITYAYPDSLRDPADSR